MFENKYLIIKYKDGSIVVGRMRIDFKANEFIIDEFYSKETDGYKLGQVYAIWFSKVSIADTREILVERLFKY